MTPLLAKLFVKDYKDAQSPKVRRRYGTLSGVVGIVCNAVLFGAKLFVAILSGAISVLADALNNLSDAGSSVVTLVGFRMAGKPADREHPFGHGRIEYVAGFIVAVLILVVGVQLCVSSVQKIITPVVPAYDIVTLVVLGAAIAVKLWMTFFNGVLSRKLDSPVLRTAAKDSLSDVVATTAVLIGALIGRYTDVNPDGYLGIVVACFILVTGIGAAKDCLSPLLGQNPGKALIEEIKKQVLSHPEIIGLHDMMVHDYGAGRKIVSLHAEVRADSDIVAIHDTIDTVERELETKFDCETTIHIDPIDLDDEFCVAITKEMTAAAGRLSPELMLHDLRTVRGPTHTNIVFDCVVPFKFGYTDAQVRTFFEEEARKLDPTYFTIVHVERNYASD